MIGATEERDQELPKRWWLPGAKGTPTDNKGTLYIGSASSCVDTAVEVSAQQYESESNSVEQTGWAMSPNDSGIILTTRKIIIVCCVIVCKYVETVR